VSPLEGIVSGIRSRVARVDPVIVGAALVGCAYRYLSHIGFDNDHFAYLARAQAWLAGDWPVRDYTEPGTLLTVGLSALTQAVFSETLLVELTLCALALGASAAVTCWVTTRLTGSRPIGAFAALLQILVLPRLYAYPKMLVYPVLLLLADRYVRLPTAGRLRALAAWAAIAFLFRHDHGAYAAAGSLALVSFVHWPEGVGRVARLAGTFGAWMLLCLSPFLLYVQASTGIRAYFGVGLAMLEFHLESAPSTPPAFHVDRWAPIARRALEPGDLPRIHIRWATGISDDDREARERRLPLLFPEHLEGRTWRYRVDPGRRDELRALFGGPDIEDVEGMNRRTLEPEPAESMWRRTLRGLGLDRLVLVPISDAWLQNAAALVFRVCWALPPLALLVWLVQRRHAHTSPQWRHALDARVPVLCLLALLAQAGIQRNEPARIADSFGTIPILLGWVLAASWAGRRTFTRAAGRAVAVLLATTTTVALAVVGNASEMISRTGVLDGPTGVLAQAAAVTRAARDWPWSHEWPGDDEWRLARYVNECTRPGDRLLVTWYAPQFQFFSRRPFAGRESYLMPVYRSPRTYESRVLESWKGQSVPIVLVDVPEYPRFTAAYPALANHLMSRYRRVEGSPWESIDVYTERDREATGRDREFGWPCFTDGGTPVDRPAR
jgi:hypothetical protein